MNTMVSLLQVSCSKCQKTEFPTVFSLILPVFIVYYKKLQQKELIPAPAKQFLIIKSLISLRSSLPFSTTNLRLWPIVYWWMRAIFKPISLPIWQHVSEQNDRSSAVLSPTIEQNTIYSCSVWQNQLNSSSSDWNYHRLFSAEPGIQYMLALQTITYTLLITHIALFLHFK